MNCKAMKRHSETLKNVHYKIKEANLKLLYIVLFQICSSLEKVKTIMKRSLVISVRGWGEIN